MSEKLSKPRRRGRRAGVFASLVALMLVASVGAVPAQGATATAWIPLRCSIGGAIQVHVGAALTTTYPDTVAPGATFNLTGTSTTVIFPPAAQQGGAVFNGDAVQGIVQDFETNLTNASASFAATAGGPTQSSPTQFNAVRAVQPPNKPASNPRINGGDTTRAGFAPATPAESFSFGDVPTDPTGQTGNRFGPVPGVGGGPNATDGTPDTLPDIGPLTVTGADGDTVTIVNQNPGGPPVMNGTTNLGPKVADNTIAFHNQGSGTPGTYGDQLGADCAFDTSTSAVAKPVAAWVDNLTIPIEAVGPPEDGVGTASARGTDPDASATVTGIGTFPVPAQYSAITNCDETANNRPFIVRANAGGQQIQFNRTGTDTSTCTSSGSTNTNEGTGTGTVSGAINGPATLHWVFDESPDDVTIDIVGDAGELHISGAPQPLSGTPGGVWVFGTLPWPAGGGV